MKTNGPQIVRIPTSETSRVSHTNATVTTSGSDTIYTWTVAGTLTIT